MRQLKPSTVLRKALTLFGDRGQRWVKGAGCIEPGERYKGKNYPKGAFCSIGAIGWIEDRNSIITYEPEELLRSVLDTSIVRFNDRKSTTFPMVRKAFKKAIALAKAEGR